MWHSGLGMFVIISILVVRSYSGLSAQQSNHAWWCLFHTSLLTSSPACTSWYTTITQNGELYDQILNTLRSIKVTVSEERPAFFKPRELPQYFRTWPTHGQCYRLERSRAWNASEGADNQAWQDKEGKKSTQLLRSVRLRILNLHFTLHLSRHRAIEQEKGRQQAKRRVICL